MDDSNRNTDSDRQAVTSKRERGGERKRERERERETEKYVKYIIH